MTEDRWFFLEGEDVTGPFSWRRLLELLDAGILDESAYVWKEGARDWIRLAEAMAFVQSYPPPIPVEAKAGFESPRSASMELIDANSSRTDDSEQLVSSRKVQKSNAPTSNWVAAPPAPWRRYAARLFDTIVHGVSGFILVAYGWYSIAPLSADAFFGLIEGPAGRIVDVIATSTLAAIIGGFVIGLTGTTIGKWTFGIRVLDSQLVPIGVVKGLGRELRVLFEGLALGIPILALFTMIAGFQRLKKQGTASWDANQNVVLYRANGITQYILNAVGVLLTASAMVGLQLLNAQQ